MPKGAIENTSCTMFASDDAHMDTPQGDAVKGLPLQFLHTKHSQAILRADWSARDGREKYNKE